MESWKKQGKEKTDSTLTRNTLSSVKAGDAILVTFGVFSFTLKGYYVNLHYILSGAEF